MISETKSSDVLDHRQRRVIVSRHMTKNEVKTGRVVPGARSMNEFSVRASLPTIEAVQRYNDYLKEHRRRLKQLVQLAAGELTPSSGGY